MSFFGIAVPSSTHSVVRVPFVKLNERASVPTYGSSSAAGADLYACEDTIVPAREQILISTGIAVEIPSGHYGRIAPRSGLSVKHGLLVGAGVVDSDYRGALKVLLLNFSDKNFTIHTGDRIAQLILEKISVAEFVIADTLEKSERGEKGFGSTG